ncbi:hypothetical protein RvY_15250 [Ramazzottius varieornatus]|uniref:Ig-like domain-containing protein n=1 Tax=Ramazzottius varieornatus TaxID=947166 RepID=A0A1D1W148_RAMVA|nr:hypothetical protein RvY_15250 [Ramazzottius varieornatus]
MDKKVQTRWKLSSRTATTPQNPKKPPTLRQSPPSPPGMKTPCQDLIVEAGKRLELPCEIENPESGVLIWKHGAKILATGTTLTSKRNKKLEGTNMILTRISNANAGNYTCQDAGEEQVEVVHAVTIIRPPSVDIQPGDKEISSEKGQPLPLSCRVQGFPQPTLE